MNPDSFTPVQINGNKWWNHTRVRLRATKENTLRLFFKTPFSSSSLYSSCGTSLTTLLRIYFHSLEADIVLSTPLHLFDHCSYWWLCRLHDASELKYIICWMSDPISRPLVYSIYSIYIVKLYCIWRYGSFSSTDICMASWVRFVLSSCRGSGSASWKVYVFVCLVLNVPEKTMEIPSCCGFLLFSSPPLLLSVHPVVLPWCYFAILHQQAAQTECFCMASRAHFSFEIPTRSHEPVHKHGHLFQLCVEPTLRFTVLPHGNRVSCAQCPRKESNKKQMTRLYRKLLISRSSWLFGLSCKCTHVWYARRGFEVRSQNTVASTHTRLKTNRHMRCWNKNVVCRPHIHMWKKKRRLCPCRSAFLPQPVTTSICAVLDRASVCLCHYCAG